MEYSYYQKQLDMKKYGCLDGDNAKRCIRCGGRFCGSRALSCPNCNTSTASIPTNCPHCNGEREWIVNNRIAICHFCGKDEKIT